MAKNDLPLPFKLHEIWSVDCQENHKNCWHQMSDFKAKMHQIRFRLGLRPRPRWGAYSASPDPLAGFKGPTSKGREGGEKREGERRGEEWSRKERRRGEGRERWPWSIPPAPNLPLHHCLYMYANVALLQLYFIADCLLGLRLLFGLIMFIGLFYFLIIISFYPCGTVD